MVKVARQLWMVEEILAWHEIRGVLRLQNKENTSNSFLSSFKVSQTQLDKLFAMKVCSKSVRRVMIIDILVIAQINRYYN